jgi:hypothetical protein
MFTALAPEALFIVTSPISTPGWVCSAAVAAPDGSGRDAADIAKVPVSDASVTGKDALLVVCPNGGSGE